MSSENLQTEDRSATEFIDDLTRRIIASMNTRRPDIRAYSDAPEASDTPVLPLAVARTLHLEELSRREAALAEAQEISAHAIRIGVSNRPGDSRMWGSDWREHLPDGHPAKVTAIEEGSFIVMGSRLHQTNLHLAHQALSGLNIRINSVR